MLKSRPDGSLQAGIPAIEVFLLGIDDRSLGEMYVNAFL